VYWPTVIDCRTAGEKPACSATAVPTALKATQPIDITAEQHDPGQHTLGAAMICVFISTERLVHWLSMRNSRRYKEKRSIGAQDGQPGKPVRRRSRQGAHHDFFHSNQVPYLNKISIKTSLPTHNSGRFGKIGTDASLQLG
jgi:hypothetical protein